MNLNLKETIKKNKIFLILFVIFLILLAILSYYFFLVKDKEVSLQPQPIITPPVQLPPLQLGEFEAAIAKIASLYDLINKLNTEFSFEEMKKKELTIRLPHEFFKWKGGNKLEFAFFTAHVLKLRQLGEVAIARYKYTDVQNQEKIGTVVIFRGHDLPPKYIIFEPNNIRAVAYGWSFEELWQMEEQRIGAKITGYEIFLLWPLPIAEQLWPKEWRQR